MAKVKGLVAFVLATMLATVIARAEGLQDAPVIGGAPQTCKDFRGVTVRTTNMQDLGDVARAMIISRMPIIAIDNDRMVQLPDKFQLFFYLHECGHHLLGHTVAPTTNSENEADCWAVKQARIRGLMTHDDVLAFGPLLANNRGTRFGHLPGPQRAARLVACYDDPSESIEDTDPAAGTSMQSAESAVPAPGPP
jgi:hypothetical protein